MNAILAGLAVAVTWAPSAFAICTANGPTLPDAPSMSTRSPGRIVRPFLSRSPWTARIAECGSVAASSKLIEAGIGWNARCGAQTNSAKAPWPNENRSAKTRSPGWNRVSRRADRLDDPRDIEADPGVPRRAHAVEQAQELRARRQPVEVGTVHRRGLDADEDLVLDGRRTVDLDELDDVRRAVAPPYGGLHRLKRSVLGPRGRAHPPGPSARMVW